MIFRESIFQVLWYQLQTSFAACFDVWLAKGIDIVIHGQLRWPPGVPCLGARAWYIAINC